MIRKLAYPGQQWWAGAPAPVVPDEPSVPKPFESLKAAGEIIHEKLHSLPREIALLYLPGLLRIQVTLDKWKP